MSAEMDTTREHVFFLVKGCSMHPVLRTGDRVKLRSIDRDEGDILVFTAEDGREIIHRVVYTAPIQTRGDNCAQNDSPVPENSPLYLAYAFRRNGTFRNLTSGSAGIREFRRNQFHRKYSTWFRKRLSFLAGLNRVRIPFNSLTKSVFQDKIVYYAGKHPVGWMDANGWHWMHFARYFVQPPEDHHE